MTALLSRAGTNFSLACDRCGYLVANLADTMYHWDHAWGLLRRHGWTGAALATGPHTCPPCVREPNPGVTGQVPSQAWSAPVLRRPNRITVTEHPRTVVLKVRGELTMPVNAALYELLLSDQLARRHVVVQLSVASTLDARTLQVLVLGQARKARCHLELCLVGLSDPMRAALHLLCLNRLLPTFRELNDALAWLSGPASERFTPPRTAPPSEAPIEVA